MFESEALSPVNAGNVAATDTTPQLTWGYGGNITSGEDGTFTVTPYVSEDKTVNYKIDTLVVDGVDVTSTLTAEEIASGYTVPALEDGAHSTIFATFAYTVNFT